VVGRLIERLEEVLLALLLAAMTLLTFTQVVLRYLFNAGLIWALEATVYLFAWLILLGISYGVRVHAHIGVDILVKALPIATRRTFGLVAVALSLLYAGVMLYGSWRYVERLHRLGTEAEDIPVERWILTIVLPIGFLLLGVRLLQQGFAILQGRAKGFELGDEAADILRERERLVGGGER
jgi:C4-dicarboxylate transporter DctQ subunit